MAWLDSWAKRIKLTIDHERVDGDLNNFPVLVTLSDDVGRNNADVTGIFDELTESNTVFIDTFSGTSLDTDKWGTHIVPNASVTVNNELRINNQSGNAHSGSHCFSKTTFDKTGVLFFNVKWKPTINDHYNTGDHGPAIVFCDPSASREPTYYGYRTNKCFKLRLAQTGAWTTNRTQLRLTNTINGTINKSINIDETVWHDLRITIDCGKATVWVDLDNGDYVFGGEINSSTWSSIGSTFVIEFSTAEYNKTNTETFKDLYVTTEDSNNKKIMVTTSDGITPCYVEIENWDWYNKKSCLWTKIPTIVSGTNTDFYLYYDKDQLDNDLYVGDVGSTPAQNVWDSNFKAVYHLGENPAAGTNSIKDSTPNTNHGTPDGSMTSDDLLDGKFGKALDFDGTDDYIDCGSDSSIDDIDTKTIEAVVYLDTFGEALYGRVIQKSNVNADGWGVSVAGGSGLNKFQFLQDWNNGSLSIWNSPTNSITTGTWYNLAITYNKTSSSNNPSIYIDGVSQTVSQTGTAPAGTCDSDSANDLWIGARKNSGSDREFDGIIDEVRISDTIRSPAWIKATYYSNWDNLIVFGTQELEPVFYYEGYITVESAPAARTINLYKRDTGELVDSTTSSGSTGYYKLGSSHNDYHFVVALPDLSEDYTPLIDDKIHPTGGN